MPTTRTLGYRCTCGTVIPFPSSGGIESIAEFEELQRKRRQSDWTLMVVHAEAVGGCGRGMLLKADDLLPVEIHSD
jgi:hypothetical protein